MVRQGSAKPSYAGSIPAPASISSEACVGGLTKRGRYEADRYSIPITLLDLDDLVDLVIQNYENMDTDARALLLLLRFCWPAP